MVWREEWRHELPIDGPVTTELVEALTSSDFDMETLRSIPVDGPWSEGELLALSRSGFRQAAQWAHSVDREGPLRTREVVESAIVRP